MTGRSRLLVVVMGFALAFGLGIGPVYADLTGYRVVGTGGGGLNVRVDPYDPGARVITRLVDGTPVTLVCAVHGRAVLGNTVWHRISAPAAGWISDRYTSTPTFDRYLPGERDCGAAPASAPTSASSREQRALAWAHAVLGQYRTGGDLGDGDHPWDGWCDNFVAHAFGRAASGYESAIAHYLDLRDRGLIRSGAAPAGALVFFAPGNANGWYGHVMISEGDGSYLSTGPTIRRLGINDPGALYLGWAWANPEWAGR